MLWVGTMSEAQGGAESAIAVWPKLDQEAFERGQQELDQFAFDALSYTSDDLVHLTLEIFTALGFPGKVNMPMMKLKKFILCVRTCMFDNPYHNWFHAFDVTQTTYCLAIHSGMTKTLSDIELFALIVSALCHDLEHPGVNNPFLVASRSDLATLYNDRSVLENHHCCRAFQLMLHSEIQLLADFSGKDYSAFRSVVLNNILATDMARHGEYTTKLKRITEAGTPHEDKQLDPQFAMEVIMKCADTSNVLKPFDIAKKWAMRVTDEFFLQGDKERAAHMPLTPMCDRTSQGRVALQKGFVDFVIGPFYRLVGDAMPGLQESFGLLWKNREAWNQYDDQRLLEELGDEY
uniref:PDEase domain-containing protein n=1 Tax=Hemiselmis tepida TaxID=464990 RepID=A0A7S0VC46_9CRYP